MAKFTLHKGNDNQFYFRLQADNNQIICISEGYASREGAMGGIEAVKRVAGSATIEDISQ